MYQTIKRGLNVMGAGLIVTLVIIAIILIVVVAWIVIYNTLVRLGVKADEAWSGITVQLKRRSDLIPNLVEAVKGYAAHESGVFQSVTEARANIVNAVDKNNIKETAAAENQFEQALKSLFAVSENYPDLRATENFQQLQAQLTDTEDKIQASRRFYNSNVSELNSKVKTVPSNIVAGVHAIKEREFYEVSEEQAKAIQEPTQVTF